MSSTVTPSNRLKSWFATLRMLWVGVLGLIAFPCTGLCGSVSERVVDLSTPAEQLQYKLTRVGSYHPSGGFTESNDNTSDVNGDGFDERIFCYTRSTGPGNFTSAVVCYTDPPRNNEFDQFNGARSTLCIWGQPRFLDVYCGPGKETILTKVVGDTVLLEIINWDALSHPVARYIVAGVGQNMPHPSSWNAINVEPLAAIDLNDDGAKELIFSRIAKPDSAFARGIVAYDLAHDRVFWFYPTADMVDYGSFFVMNQPLGDSVCFVFALRSNQNSYSVDGMDSHHAYVVSLNPDGTERWRHCAGLDGFDPMLGKFDVDGDGTDEVCVGIDARLPESNGMTTIRAYDAFHGAVITTSPRLEGAPVSSMVMTRDSLLNSASLYATCHGDSINHIYRLGPRLSIEAVVSIQASTWSAADLNADLHPELMCSSLGQKTAILDKDLNLLAWSPGSGDPQAFKSKLAAGIFVSSHPGYEMLTFSRRSVAAVLYARYKWFLAVATAIGIVLVVGVTGLWVRRLHHALAGVPSLDKVGSMVLVLNREGLVVYANQDALVKQLFGGDVSKRHRYDSPKLATHPLVRDAIRQSFIEPYTPLHSQFEIDGAEGHQRVDLVIYPRVGDRRSLLGKIVIAEDVTRQAGWQQKTILSVAIQEWVHRLKTSMATASISIGNIIENRAVFEKPSEGETLRGHLCSVKEQIDQTSDVARRILHFAGISKPVKILCGIDSVVETALAPYMKNPPRGITVARMQQENLPPVRIDPQQITEVLENLLSNAVNATGAGGRIVVSCEVARQLLAPDGGKILEITVEDTGNGIPNEYLERIFEPSFTRTPGGTGIGLALVKEIVENHGGRISVESKLGQGSRFRVQLPIES